MNIKHIIISAMVLAAGATSAQDSKPSKEEAQKQRAHKLSAELELSEEQAIRFHQIMEQNKVERKALKEKEREMFKAEREAMRELHEARVKEVLTAEQLARLEEIKAERKEARMERKGRAREGHKHHLKN